MIREAIQQRRKREAREVKNTPGPDAVVPNTTRVHKTVLGREGLEFRINDGGSRHKQFTYDVESSTKAGNLSNGTDSLSNMSWASECSSTATARTSNASYGGYNRGGYPRMMKRTRKRITYKMTCEFRSKEKETEMNVRAKFKKLWEKLKETAG